MRKSMVLLLSLIFISISTTTYLYCEKKDYEVIMYWDNEHSLTKNKHSLANWLEGKTIGANINSNGNLVIEVSYSNFPNVISSPDLNLLEGSFDAVRITYLNLMEYSKGKKPKGAIGWVDEAMAKAIEQEKSESEEGYFTTFPLKFYEWTEDIIKLKGLKNWKRGVKVKGILFTPAYNSKSAYGKFIISSIELIKFKE